MQGKDYVWLVVILAVAGWAIWIVQIPITLFGVGFEWPAGVAQSDLPNDVEPLSRRGRIRRAKLLSNV